MMKKFHRSLLLSGSLGMVKATVNPAQFVGTSHSNFPSLVIPDSMPSRFWDLVKSGGGDIRCYLDEGKTTELPREVVSCNPMSQSGEIWVRIPNFTNASSIFIDFDGISDEPAAGSTYGKHAAWSEYDFVFHHKSGEDSTGNGHDLSANGGVTIGAGTGKVKEGTDFDGSDDDLQSSISPGIVGSMNRTIQSWIKTGATNDGCIFSVGDGTSGEEWNWRIDELSGGNYSQRVEVDGGFKRFSTVINDDAYHLLHTVLVGANITDLIAYVDGLSDNEDGSSGRTINTTGSNNYYIGLDPTASRRWNGLLDDLRGRADALSSDWIQTEYNMMNDPAIFWTFE